MNDLPAIADGEDKSSPFVNCIRKNYRHIRKWAKRTNTNCFRIYDRHMTQYPFAIDYYDGRYCVHYFSQVNDLDEPPQALQDEVVAALKTIFGPEDKVIYWRTRSRSKESRQYEKTGESKAFFAVFEYGVRFQVNLVDYLDTGLFLDHRETRRMVASIASGKRLLNLFAYTSSFSVHAAMSGATFTKSVDMSNTYCDWSRDNFLLNGLSLKNNEIVRADCLKFLQDEGDKYDIIVIDPPTISRSKKMDQLFDVQVDYIFLIRKSLELLREGGVVFFSTNSRRFVFDASQFPGSSIVEVSHKTLPIDFHDPRIHRCWKISLAKNSF